MEVNHDWYSELQELREAVHQLDGRISQILSNIDKANGSSDVTRTAELDELDELGEH